MRKSLIVSLIILTLAISAQSQTDNLLHNPNADEGINHWRGYGNASVEGTADGRLCFVVRNGAYFLQDAVLPDGSVGKYAVLIGRVASERINPDGAITGLPYLYGYMLEKASPRGGIIKAHLQAGDMLCRANRENQWVTVWGIFQVPPETGAIRFFLKQALRNGVPHNGSAARFDDLGLYLFNTEEEARAFVKMYKDQRQ